MTHLYQCTRCMEPFVAQDQLRIALRDGYCPECMKIEILKAFGLPADFLTRRLGPST
jgi:DNA-directed RNA polymerase subunit RPC12/RpoP